MSDLSSSEKVLFGRLFDMCSGYVMNFTNATFAEFFREHGIDIYSERYAFNGNSKANGFVRFGNWNRMTLSLKSCQRC